MICPPDPRLLREMRGGPLPPHPPDQVGLLPDMREVLRAHRAQRGLATPLPMSLLEELPQRALHDLPPSRRVPGGPHIRIGETIPAGKGFFLGEQPLPPLQGPVGYGVCIESEESPDMIDFYPCEKEVRSISLPRSRAASHAPRLERHGASAERAPPFYHITQQGYVSFDFPSPSHPVDMVDPKWKQMFSELSRLDKEKLDTAEDRDKLFEQQIMPMMEYIKGVPGDVAAGYHEKLVQKVKDLEKKDETSETQG